MRNTGFYVLLLHGRSYYTAIDCDLKYVQFSNFKPYFVHHPDTKNRIEIGPLLTEEIRFAKLKYSGHLSARLHLAQANNLTYDFHSTHNIWCTVLIFSHVTHITTTYGHTEFRQNPFQTVLGCFLRN